MSQQQRREDADAARRDDRLQAKAMQTDTGPSKREQARLLETVLPSDSEGGSGEQLRNLLAKDLPLANFDEAHITEVRWWLEVVLERYEAMHPPQGSAMQGAFRAWCAGDLDAYRTPLSPEQLARDEQLIRNAFSRATRGEDMAQQESASRSINENVLRRDGTGQSGGGILGRMR